MTNKILVSYDYGEMEQRFAALVTPEEAMKMVKKFNKTYPQLQRLNKQKCEHSFNNENFCEYCGLDEMEYEHRLVSGEEK